jgi:hypothetical protein
MAERIVVDPITRIEGHLRAEVETLKMFGLLFKELAAFVQPFTPQHQ